MWGSEMEKFSFKYFTPVNEMKSKQKYMFKMMCLLWNWFITVLLSNKSDLSKLNFTSYKEKKLNHLTDRRSPLIGPAHLFYKQLLRKK